MQLENLPVNIIGVLFFFGWFLAGLWAMKSFAKGKKMHMPPILKTVILLLAPVFGFISAASYLVWCYKDRIAELFAPRQGTGKTVKKKNENGLPLVITDEAGRDMLRKNENDESAKAVLTIIRDALESKTSDIFIDPKNGSYLVRFRVDGSIREHSTLSEEEALPVISMLKVFASMDITEKRRPQDGAFNATYGYAPAAFRVATVGVYGGEKVTLRVIASESGNRSLTDLGLSRNQYAKLSSAVKLPSGMILICGPTGSGKTSTLYSLLGSIDYGLKNVISIEDPVERVIPNISQIEVNTKAGITFASVLRNSLRQNPDVICLGEIRDEETAGVAAQAAQTGHLIVATLHSNDNIGTMVRLTDLGIPLRNIAAALQVSVSQRLIRRLCPDCKKNAELNEVQKAYCQQYGIPFDAIKMPCGCPKCGNTGYKGRIAVFEILTMDDGLRQVLERPGSTISDVKAYVDSAIGTGALGSRIMSYVINGETSWDEYERATVNF